MQDNHKEFAASLLGTTYEFAVQRSRAKDYYFVVSKVGNLPSRWATTAQYDPKRIHLELADRPLSHRMRSEAGRFLYIVNDLRVEPGQMETVTKQVETALEEYAVKYLNCSDNDLALFAATSGPHNPDKAEYVDLIFESPVKDIALYVYETETLRWMFDIEPLYKPEFRGVEGLKELLVIGVNKG